MNFQDPAVRRPSGAAVAARVAGTLLVLVGLALVITAGVDFFATVSSGPDVDSHGPTKFWMLFVGLPLIAVGGWLLIAGFIGAASRLAYRRGLPMMRGTMAAMGVRPLGTGCATCGTANAPGARFCATCGSALARPCPSCAAVNASTAAYCSQCGGALT